MSKEKPEVGDVWEINNYKHYIIDIKGGAMLALINLINDWYEVRGASVETFIKQGKYLGKSKVSIEELFDVVV